MVEGETENEEQYYDYAATGHDKRFFDDNNNDDDDDGSVTGDVSTDDDEEDHGGDSLHSYDFEKSQQNNFHDTSYYSEEEGSYDLYGDDGIDDDDDDDSLGFPPGHITRLDEMHMLKNNNTNNNNNNNNSGGKKTSSSSSVNPSIIPSYFFCPITQTIMKDPVITPDGTTFERRAILRSLCLEPVNPITRRPLLHTELVDDQLVRTSIDKARKEAWVRYVVEFEDDSFDDNEGDGKEYAKKIYEEKVVAKMEKKRLKEIDSLLVDITGEHLFDEGGSDKDGEEKEQQQQESPSRSTTKVKNDPQAPQSSISVSSPTLNSTYEQQPPGQNHGWLVPLGVHKIMCSSPGLIVTADVHRRSKVVKRRMLKKSLVGGGKSTSNENQQKKKKQSIKKRFSPRKQSHHQSAEEEYKRRVQSIKTTTTAITEDLVLPPGSHVEILETRIHGGRVRGKITWEEEVTVQLDDALVDEIKRQEEIVEMMSKVTVVSSENKEKKTTKKKGFFRRKQHDKRANNDGAEEEDDVATTTTQTTTVPYTSNLSTNEIPSPKRRDRKTKKKERSSPITSIKYTGWISLQWAGEIGNHEKDEAMRRRRDTINDYKRKKVDDYHPHLIADEDDGPWSRPLPLGVYRIGNDNVSVSDVPEVEESTSSSTLVALNSGDLVEVVEMQVVMMKRKVSDPRSQFSMLTSDYEGVRTVRARCMMSSSVDIGSSSATQKRFKSGWITLSEEGKSSDGKQQHHIINASPIPVGAHVVSSNHGPLMSYAGSKIKTILPSGSCMEVDATRIEFDESETVECNNCGADSTYPLIAVKALISLGGYATLFTLPVKGKSSLCSCGQILSNPTYFATYFAEPVKLGVYKVIHPDGVFLTEGIGPNTPVISTLKQDALAEVTETRVEDGCVRGKINIFLSCDLSEMGDKNTGWISLFEPPNFVWAELVTEKKGK
jgi:hypothetical protein